MFDLNKNGKIDNWEVVAVSAAAFVVGIITGIMI